MTPLEVFVVSRDAFGELLGHLPGLSETLEGIARAQGESGVEWLLEISLPHPPPGARWVSIPITARVGWARVERNQRLKGRLLQRGPIRLEGDPIRPRPFKPDEAVKVFGPRPF